MRPTGPGDDAHDEFLAEKLAELSQLYLTAPVGLCLMDTDLRFVRINERLAAINGRSVEDHIGCTLREVLPRVADLIEPIYRRVIESGEPEMEFEVEAVTPAAPAETICCLVSYYPLKSDDDKVTGVSTVVQDITDRKRTEQALGRSEQRYRSLLETTRAIPWEADARDWCFTYVGPQAVELLGYPIESWMDAGFWTDRIHPDDRQRALEFCKRASTRQVNYEIEYRMIAADGRAVWLHDIVSVEKAEGQPVVLRGFMIDISERKRVEDALQLSEERYRDLYENAPDMFCSVDAGSGSIQHCNRTLVEKTGFAREEIIGRHVDDIYDPDSLESEKKIAQRIREDGELRDVELSLLREDGGKMPVSLNVSAIRDESGAVVYSRATWRDVTSRKRAEEKARASEAALRISEEYLRYLTGRMISAQEEERRRLARELHDDLSQRLAGLAIDTANLEHRLQGVPEAGERLREMRDRIMEISTTVQTISRQLHPSILDDLGLVSAIESECVLFSKREGIPVLYEPLDVPKTLPKDVALCLYRVTQEGLRNVAKHASATEARVSLSGGNGAVVLRVEDAGSGFEPQKARGGAGLGLASMEERVRLIKGGFSIESQPGLGTVIEVRAPVSGRQP